MCRLALILCCLPVLAGAQNADAVIPNLIAPNTETTQVAVTVDPGLRSSKRLRSRALRQARADLQANRAVDVADLRRLAEAGDGPAAQRYVRALEAQRDADPSDLAYFSAIAVGTGRVWTLKTMVAAMHHLDPAKEPRARIRKYIRVLYPHAWAGNSLAFQAVIDFNGEGRLFGPLSQRTRDRIQAEARDQGDGRIELGMAMALLEQLRNGDGDSAKKAEARDLLKQAETSGHLAVRTTALNLLRIIDGPTADDS